jgi:hypothetical protein
VPRDASRMVRDPRVETLTSWARADGQLSGREVASLAALEDALRFPATTPVLAYVPSAAYAGVPGRGPRDIAAGNRIVRVLRASARPAPASCLCCETPSGTGTRDGRSPAR